MDHVCTFGTAITCVSLVNIQGAALPLHFTAQVNTLGGVQVYVLILILVKKLLNK